MNLLSWYQIKYDTFTRREQSFSDRHYWTIISKLSFPDNRFCRRAPERYRPRKPCQNVGLDGFEQTPLLATGKASAGFVQTEHTATETVSDDDES